MKIPVIFTVLGLVRHFKVQCTLADYNDVAKFRKYESSSFTKNDI